MGRVGSDIPEQEEQAVRVPYYPIKPAIPGKPRKEGITPKTPGHNGAADFSESCSLVGPLTDGAALASALA